MFRLSMFLRKYTKTRNPATKIRTRGEKLSDERNSTTRSRFAEEIVAGTANSFEEVVSDEFYDTSAIEANDHRTVKTDIH